jgi:cation diffusion facilitator CzcD-associated flavoprotein CzcO
MLWFVVSEDIETKERTHWTANVLIQAVGTYNRKKIPHMPGSDSFEGEVWHTVDWPAKYDFSNKRVAYIGTGPTSLQALPAVQSQAESLSIYVRSMTHCHPFRDFKYPKWLLWIFCWIPGTLSVYAALVSTLFGIWAWFVFRPNTFLARCEEAHCNRHLTTTVPDPDLRAKLRPTGRFGAKRPLVSPSFLALVQRPNVSVIAEDLGRMDATGIVSTCRRPYCSLDHPMDKTNQAQLCERHRSFDVIIWGTGFLMQGWGSMVPTRGLNGVLLADHWRDEPRTLYGKVPMWMQLCQGTD